MPSLSFTAFHRRQSRLPQQPNQTYIRHLDSYFRLDFGLDVAAFDRVKVSSRDRGRVSRGAGKMPAVLPGRNGVSDWQVLPEEESRKSGGEVESLALALAPNLSLCVAM